MSNLCVRKNHKRRFFPLRNVPKENCWFRIRFHLNARRESGVIQKSELGAGFMLGEKS